MEPLIRLAIKISSGQRQRLASMPHLQPAPGKIFRSRRFRNNRRRPARQRILRELPAIGVPAWKCEEQIARIDAARIVSQAADIDGGKLRPYRLLEPLAREYLA
jgi:hypothetical protein